MWNIWNKQSQLPKAESSSEKKNHRWNERANTKNDL